MNRRASAGLAIMTAATSCTRERLATADEATTPKSGYVETSLDAQFVLVRGTTYTMGPAKPFGALTEWGYPVENDGVASYRQHEVTIGRDFLAQKYETTQQEWFEVMDSNPSRVDCADCPVNNVNWYAVLRYANLLSKKHGLEACYSLDDCTGTVGGGVDDDCTSTTDACGQPLLECRRAEFAGPSCAGFRLPTEAEWELLATSGGVEGGTPGATQAWLSANSGGRVHLVGQKAANAAGVFDAAGNVWEMTSDGCAGYPSGAVVDPVVKVDNGDQSQCYIIRGGSIDAGGDFESIDTLNPRFRGVHSADYRAPNIGFRLVRSAVPAP